MAPPGDFRQRAQQVFGTSFDANEVSDCRIVRAKVQVRGLAGAATAAAIGLQPTWLTVVLADGRTFKAQARGPGPEKEAIEALNAELNARKARKTRDELQAEGRVTFGPCTLTSTTFSWGKKSHGWDELVGFRVGEGYLQLDTARGLWASVLLSAVPFSDALVTLVAEQLPGKDYAQLPPSQWPSFGFLTPSAATHPGGTMTGRGRLAVLGGLAALGLAAAGGYFGWVWYQQNVVHPAQWAQFADGRTEKARSFTRDDAAFFAPGLATCPKPKQDWSWVGPVLAAQGDGPRAWWLLREGRWRKTDKLENSPDDDVYAWTVGPKDGQNLVRVARQKYEGPECRLAAVVTPDAQGKEEELAKKLIDHSVPSVDFAAPPPAVAPAPVATPEPVAAQTTAPAKATKKKAVAKATRNTKKPRKR